MGQDGGVGPGVISFFSGIGVLDLGFEQAGFRTWLANEIHPAYADAYMYGRSTMCLPQPVRGIHRGGFAGYMSDGWRRMGLLSAMGEAREELGCVGFIGGPPCPDFSVAGSQGGEDGANGRLTRAYAELIVTLQPDFFLFENVAGLWSTGKNREFYMRLRKGFREAGYSLSDRLANALDYGVAQDRRRVFLVGFRDRSFTRRDASAMAAGFPWLGDIAHSSRLGLPWPGTSPFVADGALPAPPGLDESLCVEWWFRRNAVDLHDNARHHFRPRAALERFRTIPEGDTGGKSFKRLHRWRYSPAAAYGNNEVHLHPYKERRLSVAEALAIQSLPRGFALPDGMTLSDMFKTVGNAVPYRMANSVAASLSSSLFPDAAPPRPAASSTGAAGHH